jgi:hypothetical protein
MRTSRMVVDHGRWRRSEGYGGRMRSMSCGAAAAVCCRRTQLADGWRLRTSSVDREVVGREYVGQGHTFAITSLAWQQTNDCWWLLFVAFSALAEQRRNTMASGGQTRECSSPGNSMLTASTRCGLNTSMRITGACHGWSASAASRSCMRGASRPRPGMPRSSAVRWRGCSRCCLVSTRCNSRGRKRSRMAQKVNERYCANLAA